MNSLTSNPTAAGALARRTIEDRVRDAEQRRIARMLRDERRANARAARTAGAHREERVLHRPWWARRLLHPAH